MAHNSDEILRYSDPACVLLARVPFTRDGKSLVFEAGGWPDSDETAFREALAHLYRQIGHPAKRETEAQALIDTVVSPR